MTRCCSPALPCTAAVTYEVRIVVADVGMTTADGTPVAGGYADSMLVLAEGSLSANAQYAA